MIKVFVLDDHPIFRQVLTLILERYTEFRVVGDATNIAEALAKVGKLQPDVVIMDDLMPGIEGAAAITLLRQKCPRVKVLKVHSPEDKKVSQGLRAKIITSRDKGTDGDS